VEFTRVVTLRASFRTGGSSIGSGVAERLGVPFVVLVFESGASRSTCRGRRRERQGR
jgi:hypothetical protein